MMACARSVQWIGSWQLFYPQFLVYVNRSTVSYWKMTTAIIVIVQPLFFLQFTFVSFSPKSLHLRAVLLTNTPRGNTQKWICISVLCVRLVSKWWCNEGVGPNMQPSDGVFPQSFQKPLIPHDALLHKQGRSQMRWDCRVALEQCKEEVAKQSTSCSHARQKYRHRSIPPIVFPTPTTVMTR